MDNLKLNIMDNHKDQQSEELNKEKFRTESNPPPENKDKTKEGSHNKRNPGDGNYTNGEIEFADGKETRLNEETGLPGNDEATDGQ
ncbi:hypothetical protein TH53_02035 [Pedobacter lusitanus]|uniref:Uncharacterized protein n=2 Tax=Pedobacter lusitanus TaxID=1503925 RepID=A0A0D0G1M6_9SPHI|nr:hypothetical protein TH53_02035 [Pedobacter lusitanus]